MASSDNGVKRKLRSSGLKKMFCEAPSEEKKENRKTEDVLEDNIKEFLQHNQGS